MSQPNCWIKGNTAYYNQPANIGKTRAMIDFDEYKKIVRVANKNAKSCEALSQEIDRLNEKILNLEMQNDCLHRWNGRK